MGLERVKERVLEEARQKAKERISYANAEAQAILKSASNQIREKEAELRSQLEAEVISINRREAAAAKLESKKLTLEFKNSLIEGVFSQAIERLSNLSEKERANHIKNLLQKANSELKAAVIYCNGKDAKHVNGYKAKESGIAGGIIAESANGELRVNYSYEELVEQLKETLLPEIDKLLFAGKK